MSIVAFVTQLKQAGVRVWVKGDKLCCKGPEAALTEEVVNHLQKIKPEVMRLLVGDQMSQPHQTKGYGCASCGNRIYKAVQTWEISELPAPSPWKYEHTPAVHWKCEGCGTIFQYIGGTRGPNVTH